MKTVTILECDHCGAVLYPTGNCSGCGTSTGNATPVEVECKGNCSECIASVDCYIKPEPQAQEKVYECSIWLCGEMGGDCSYCPSRF